MDKKNKNKEIGRKRENSFKTFLCYQPIFNNTKTSWQRQIFVFIWFLLGLILIGISQLCLDILVILWFVTGILLVVVWGTRQKVFYICVFSLSIFLYLWMFLDSSIDFSICYKAAELLQITL